MRWIIGDIHGMLRPLETLLEAVRRVDRDARFYFVGDYVNRGPQARSILDLLLGLPNAAFIRGNHDDIFDQVLHGISFAPNASDGDRLLAFQWFLEYGLASTLISYGCDWAELEHLASHPTAKRLDALLASVPPDHRRFIRTLPTVIEDPDLFVAHGRWDPDEPDESPSIVQRLTHEPGRRQQLLWGRFEPAEVIRTKAWRRTGYFGHTPVECYPDLLADERPTPLRADKIVLLDTGVALSPLGRLTAFCHETQSYLQTSHFGTLLTPEPQKKTINDK